MHLSGELILIRIAQHHFKPVGLLPRSCCDCTLMTLRGNNNILIICFIIIIIIMIIIIICVIMHNVTGSKQTRAAHLPNFGALVLCMRLNAEQHPAFYTIRTEQTVRHKQELWKHFAAVKGRLNRTPLIH